jgi:hypothetical protein
MEGSILSYNQIFMGNTTNPLNAETGEKKLDRRSFMAHAGAAIAGATVATASLARAVLAEETTPIAERPEDFSDIPYRESELGIDYRAIAEFPVDHMLSQGEAEFMENASDVFGDDTAETWGHFMAPEIGSGGVSEYTIEGMREFTPNMLLSFAQRFSWQRC